MTALRILHETTDYQVQNFPLFPQPGGRDRREGGKFVPTPYKSNDDLSHLISPDEFRKEYGDGFESSSVIDDCRPVNKIGTRNRKVYRRHSAELRGTKGTVES
jgi:hypothetical protein